MASTKSFSLLTNTAEDIRYLLTRLGHLILTKRSFYVNIERHKKLYTVEYNDKVATLRLVDVVYVVAKLLQNNYILVIHEDIGDVAWEYIPTELGGNISVNGKQIGTIDYYSTNNYYKVEIEDSGVNIVDLSNIVKAINHFFASSGGDSILVIVEDAKQEDYPLGPELEAYYIESGKMPWIDAGFYPDYLTYAGTTILHSAAYETTDVLRAATVEILHSSGDYMDVLTRCGQKDAMFFFGHFKWRSKSPAAIAKSAQETPESFPAIIAGRNNILYRSNRAYTSMYRIRPLTNLKVSRLPVVDRRIPLHIGSSIYLPVSRYATGMSRGSYYDYEETSNNVYCGTFYYWEPDSHVWLSVLSTRVQFYENKLGAAATLIRNRNIPKTKRIALNAVYGNILSNYTEILYTRKELLTNTLATREEIASAILDMSLGNNTTLFVFDSSYTVDGIYLNLFYAEEDDFDQPLCDAAKSVGIDILVLSRMAGSRRVVTELLDTRTRIASLTALVWELI